MSSTGNSFRRMLDLAAALAGLLVIALAAGAAQATIPAATVVSNIASLLTFSIVIDLIVARRAQSVK